MQSFKKGLPMKLKTYILLIIAVSVFGCASNDVLTEREMAVQSKADSIVAGLLFETDMNDQASYNISKSSSVTIKFAESVTQKSFTKIVDLLRSNKSIDGVYAEQSGAEVCGLGLK